MASKAGKWVMTHNQTETGFEVTKIEAARKPGYVVVYAKYPTSDTTYTYVRKGNVFGENAYTVVDGCKVVYNATTFEYISSERVYDTAGMRKQTNIGGAGKGSVVEKLRNEVASMRGADSKQVGDVGAASGVADPKVGQVRHQAYGMIKQCMECNIPVYLAGPAGCGKNYTVEQIAKELGWNFYFSNSVQQEYKLTGFIDAGGKFHETEFYKACTGGNDCVFFLDEIDASIPEVLVLLNAAIANGYFEFPNGRVNLEHVHFVAAGNTVGNGADDEYTGRMVIDQATLDRFAIIEFGYDRNVEMSISNGNDALIDFVHQLRDAAKCNGIRATFSLRCLTMVTKLENAGMAMVDIVKIAVVKGLDKDTVRTLAIGGDSKYHKALREVQAAA